MVRNPVQLVPSLGRGFPFSSQSPAVAGFLASVLPSISELGEFRIVEPAGMVRPRTGETADIWKSSLMVRIDTGWKPILFYITPSRVAKGPRGWFPHNLELSLDGPESNVA
jgi:hypothetical protein